MGVCYKVICENCKVFVDLYKDGHVASKIMGKPYPEKEPDPKYIWITTVFAWFVYKHKNHLIEVVSDASFDERYYCASYSEGIPFRPRENK